MCSQYTKFPIKLHKVSHFNNAVLFIEPKKNKELNSLHNLFDNNNVDEFQWHPHITIFCDNNEKQVVTARKHLSKLFAPINATITGIQLGEFFPSKIITCEHFNNNSVQANHINYSYVMGVGNEIHELKKYGFNIKKKGGNYIVTFSDANIKVWENFISKHLEVGYWNEYITKNSVIFLFSLDDGIHRFEVMNFDNQEVLALCEKLCNRKFESIRKMLTENKFYNKVLKKLEI